MKIPVAFKVENKLLTRMRALTINSKEEYAPTMTQFLEVAIERECERLEEKKRNGK